VARAERVKRREERAKRRKAELLVPNFIQFVTENHNDDASSSSESREWTMERERELTIIDRCN
jgi:hypothetical protein